MQLMESLDFFDIFCMKYGIFREIRSFFNFICLLFFISIFHISCIIHKSIEKFCRYERKSSKTLQGVCCRENEIKKAHFALTAFYFIFFFFPFFFFEFATSTLHSFYVHTYSLGNNEQNIRYIYT